MSTPCNPRASLPFPGTSLFVYRAPLCSLRTWRESVPRYKPGKIEAGPGKNFEIGERSLVQTHLICSRTFAFDRRPAMATASWRATGSPTARAATPARTASTRPTSRRARATASSRSHSAAATASPAPPVTSMRRSATARRSATSASCARPAPQASTSRATGTPRPSAWCAPAASAATPPARCARCTSTRRM